MEIGELGPILTIVVLLASGVATSAVALYRLKSVEEQIKGLGGHERDLNLKLTEALARLAGVTESMIEFQGRTADKVESNQARGRLNRERVSALEEATGELRLLHISSQSGIPVDQLKGVSGVVSPKPPERSAEVPVR